VSAWRNHQPLALGLHDEPPCRFPLALFAYNEDSPGSSEWQQYPGVINDGRKHRIIFKTEVNTNRNTRKEGC